MNDNINNSHKVAAPRDIRNSLLLSALCAICASLASAAASGFLMCVSGVFFAFSFFRCKRLSWLAVLPAYILAILLVKDLFAALVSLLFLAVALPLIVCIRRRCSLSVTTAVLTVATAAVFAVLFSVGIIRTYGELINGYHTYVSDVRASMDEVFNSFRAVTDENGFAVVPEQAIAAIREVFVMTAPAAIVVLCELMAYITAKMFLLLCCCFKDSELISRPWRLRTSVVTSVVFAASYLIFVFANDANVVYYSAVNLMLMLMPLTSISGFHAMFGESSAFRRSQRPVAKGLLIASCVMLAIIGTPLFLLAMLSFWGAFDGIVTYIKSRKKHVDGDNSDLPE